MFRLLLIPFILPALTRAGNAPKTCPNELKAYQQCVLSNPTHCYPTCTNVEVTVNPELLASMQGPTKACDTMKIMSCAYQQSCCKDFHGVETACMTEKEVYWRCIEEKAGCGSIICEAVLNPPENESPATNTPNTEDDVKETENPTVPETTVPEEGDDTEEGTEVPRPPNHTTRTCATQLQAYQKCVVSNPTHCYSACKNVDVILNPTLLATMQSPTRACDAMKIMSCAYQGWCCKNREGVETACVDEENAYWQCIEKEAGCGVIICDTDSKPSENEAPTNTPDTENNIEANPPSEPNPGIDAPVEEDNGEGPLSPQVDGEEDPQINVPSNNLTTHPNQHPRTCAAQLKVYQQCVLSNPTHCYATCTNVEVTVNPELLASMQGPTKACDTMKIMSCAYQQSCCKDFKGLKTACTVEEQSYWRCIEEEAGCGAIRCETVLDPINTASTPTIEDSHAMGAEPGSGISTQVDTPITTPIVAASGNITVKGTKQPRTCPGTLKAYQQCVLAHPKNCYPTCTNVDVILNPRLLATMKSPTTACYTMKLMSCAYQQSCCKNFRGVETACIKEKRAYWRCIETQAGCGVINCSKVKSTLPRISTVSTPMGKLIEKTKLRKKSSNLPQLDEECKAEYHTMQECHIAKNCSNDCGDSRVEDTEHDRILNLCWMQGCCERCGTEQTSYRQCVEDKAECSLDCMMDLNELEGTEEYDIAGDSAGPPTSLRNVRVAVVLYYLISVWLW